MAWMERPVRRMFTPCETYCGCQQIVAPFPVAGIANLGVRFGSGGKTYPNGLERNGEDVQDKEEDVQVDRVRHELELLAVDDHNMGQD